jgi:4'-phosphopantetheinyl transferase EntD
LKLVPEEVFSRFLNNAVAKGWIKSFTWHPFKRASLDPAFSKTHKEGDDGALWQVEVESPEGYRVGVDLEYHIEGRPLFKNKDWLERRLKIPQATIQSLSAEQLLEEWCYREASFKALYPHNEGVTLSDFERIGETLHFSRDEEEHSFALMGEWQGPWFLALARRNS